jgi:hypothetical protein
MAAVPTQAGALRSRRRAGAPLQRDRVLFGSAQATQLRYRSAASPASAAT